MDLFERIPTHRLENLDRMTFECYCGLNPNSKYEKSEQQEHFNLIKRYVASALKGKQKHTYKFSSKSEDGRMFAGSSVQGLDGIVRGYLFQGVTTDVDMKNCHPTLLEFICKKHGIECPNLEYFNRNRAQVLERLGTDAKVKVLAMVNSDKKMRHNDDFMRNFDKECKKIQALLATEEDYARYVTQAAAANARNVLGSFINRVLCFYENMVLQVAVSTMTRRSIEISTLMFDGMMIYGDHGDDLLADLDAATEEAFPGLGMKWAFKPHPAVLTDGVLETMEPKKNELSEWEMGERTLEKYPHWVYCQGTLYAFDDGTGLIHKTISPFLRTLGRSS